MKKMIILLSAFSLSGIALIGCGNDEAPPPESTGYYQGEMKPKGPAQGGTGAQGAVSDQ